MDLTALARDVADATLSPMERVRFLNMCHDTTHETLATRGVEQIEAHLDYLEGAATINRELNLILAGRIGQSLRALIALGPHEPSCNALLRGAIEYFTLAGDADDDLSGSKGLDDDARVVTAAAKAIGHPELAVSTD